MAGVRGFLEAEGGRAWLVGGSVRSLLLGREPADLDIVTEGDPQGPARRFADRTGGSFVLLSEKFHTCRVAAGGRLYDFTAMRGGGMDADLGQRDFTVNAMALELFPGSSLLDPFGGREDLEQRRLAAVSDGIFREDPLRLLRAVRLELKEGFSPNGALEELVRRDAAMASLPAAERVYNELALLLELPGTAAAARRLDRLGLLEPLLPELAALKGVEQNRYHHLDAYEHTLAHAEALGRLVEDPESVFPGDVERIMGRRRRRAAGAAPWDFIMGFASLMHDIAKPGCAFTDTEGQIRFLRHELRGAEMVRAVLSRLRAERATRNTVSTLVAGHMRFENLIQSGASRRARLRYLRATEPFCQELVMLSVADRLSVRGEPVSAGDVENHMRLAREMMRLAFDSEEALPAPPIITGNELMRELGIEQGPLVGRLLERVGEEQQLGNISTRDEALAAARRLREELA